jgi:hypothetical protein
MKSFFIWITLVLGATGLLFAQDQSKPTIQIPDNLNGSIETNLQGCPPDPGGFQGQLFGKPDKTIDKDGDGVRDRKYAEFRDREGNNVQVWCLDKGANGDYRVYAGRQGRVDKQIASCNFHNGLNKWVIEVKNGIIKRFRGANAEPAINGVNRDFEFYFEFDLDRYMVTGTNDKKIQDLATAFYISEALPIVDGLDASFVSVDSTSVESFVEDRTPKASYDVPAGVCSAEFLKTANFEKVSGQYLLEVNETIGGVPQRFTLLYNSESLGVEKLRFRQKEYRLQLDLLERTSSKDRELIVTIPRGLLDHSGYDERDRPFEVSFDGKNVDPRSVRESGSDTDRIVSILVPPGVRRLEIVGNRVGRAVRVPTLTSFQALRPVGNCLKRCG